MFDSILPPQCPMTGEKVSRSGRLSANGWSQIQFVDDPVCITCGVPFAIERGEGASCGACLAFPPSFDRARAAVVYDDNCHKLIVSFKHSDRTELAPLFANWVARVGANCVGRESLILPVPLHKSRLFGRRYNQAALVAEPASEILSCRYNPFCLQRVRKTPPQQLLSAEARMRNVTGAFAVRQEARELIKNADCVLVDDVLTTGATVSACARALKRAGAARVDVLVIARVVLNAQNAI